MILESSVLDTNGMLESYTAANLAEKINKQTTEKCGLIEQGAVLAPSLTGKSGTHPCSPG